MPPRSGLGWRYVEPGCVEKLCPTDVVWSVNWVDRPIGQVKIKASVCAERGYHVFSADGKQLYTIKEEAPGCCNMMYVPFKIEMGDSDIQVGSARRYIRRFGFGRGRPPYGITFPETASKEHKALLLLAFVQIDRDILRREMQAEMEDEAGSSL